MKTPQKQFLVGELGAGWMLTRPFALYPSCLFPNNRSAAQPPGKPHYALATKCWVQGLPWPRDLTLPSWASSCEAPWAQRQGQGIQVIHKILLSIYHAWHVCTLVSGSGRYYCPTLCQRHRVARGKNMGFGSDRHAFKSLLSWFPGPDLGHSEPQSTHP